MNPLDEFQQMKTAGWKDDARGAAVSGALVPLTGAAVFGVASAADKIYGAITKARDFKTMLEYNPHLVEYQQADPKRFNQLYSTLRNANRDFAADPIIAGGYMEKMVQPGASGAIAGQAYSERVPNPMLDIFARGGVSGAQHGIFEPARRQHEKEKLDVARSARPHRPPFEG